MYKIRVIQHKTNIKIRVKFRKMDNCDHNFVDIVGVNIIWLFGVCKLFVSSSSV